MQETGGAASILIELGMEADTIAAALIREKNESSDEQPDSTVDLLLSELKKIDLLKTQCKTIHEAQNIRNMLFALTSDIRAIFIKLAEKLHFLRTLDSSPGDERRKPAARECLDIYAPIAGRLGIFWIKNEMEDLSLKFLNRETYQQIKNLVAEKRGERDQFLEFACNTIKAEANAAGIEVGVESRAKHFYSVYMKMRKRGISPAEIYDLSAIRIISGSIEKCYTLLGIVHRLWKPVSGCFDDYIANPKPNGYQSLHTTVMIPQDINDEGKKLEIQIRTTEMHRIAEYGAASHWLYKKGSSRDIVSTKDIGIVNMFKDWKQGEDFSPLWLEAIKAEIFKKWVYLFTPQGKVVKLPEGATPIDFAYHIHTAVGESCIGAKADGHIIPLNSQLINTQVVEILTSSRAHPHPNWLEQVKSPKTRSKIRTWLEKNDESFSSEKTAEKKKKAVEEPAVALLVPEKRDLVQRVAGPLTSVLQVSINGEKNMMVRFARCCNPVTGDPITGYVSRGRGIIIHKENCSCLANNPESLNRR
ncbi:MAG: HD domain-containing protein, partial [Treponema sp.]|nr:HD domain-containing protein [Treponema sp.]